MSWLFGGRKSSESSRNFNVIIYEEDYTQLCAWVLRKPNIETGGDLFGLWSDKRTAVIQLVLGPGQGCSRTSVSFYQDVNYLQRVGSYLTQNEGVCHIGEWHSHHQLGLAQPSGGDERTVWNNMPTYNLKRFVIFIATIQSSKQSYNVNIGCFLFEIDEKGNRLDVLPGEFTILQKENPFSGKVSVEKKKGAEKDNENKVAIADLELEVKAGGKSPCVTYMKRLPPKRPKKTRKFKVVIYEDDYKELCAWVLKKPDIETGGDLFGLWSDKRTAVIQLVLGPGKDCRRTSTSFYQDIDYLQRVGSYLTRNEGVCHIGKWRFHRQMGLARPSEGDENTVWNNMPTYNLKRFVIFIATIQSSKQSYNVHIGCFLFEIDEKENHLDVLPGEFTILQKKNLLSLKHEVSMERSKDAEMDDESKITIKELKLEPWPSVMYLKPSTTPDAKTPTLLHCYGMKKHPRGICVIINNVNFDDGTKREGADVDEKELEKLFKELFFNVRVHNDLKWDEMRKLAGEYGKMDHSKLDGFVFIVMSHGGERDVIYGVDGRPIRVEDLMSEFKASNCPTLQNKPKMFFIQTCRGSMKETSNSVNTSNADSCIGAFSPDSTLPKGVCPQEADFLLSFSASPGYVAWRNSENGSYYIQTLVEVLRKHHSCNHLLDMLTEVNRLVVERGQKADGKPQPIQVPAPVYTLRGKVYL